MLEFASALAVVVCVSVCVASPVGVVVFGLNDWGTRPSSKRERFESFSEMKRFDYFGRFEDRKSHRSSSVTIGVP